ncbi:MAG: hypothetical protein ACF788_01315 [Novipirellula sp. JB048]
MASRLFGLARQLSEYLRNRRNTPYRDADSDTRQQPGSYDRARSLLDRFRRTVLGNDENEPQQPQSPPRPRPGKPYPPPPPTDRPRRPGAAPPRYPPPPPTVPPGPFDDGEEFDDIQLLGRDAGYHADDFAAVMDSMRRTLGSSNVWGYFFERESRRTGIMYVTFLRDVNGKKTDQPGPTYAYYDVSVTKANEFQRMAATSAGSAVWDYFRIRGTVYGHQHQYRLVHASGEYVPRKATPQGWKARAVPNLGVGRRGFRRNTLSPRTFGNGGPNRGGPDRGGPNRGTPNRGS